MKHEAMMIRPPAYRDLRDPNYWPETEREAQEMNMESERRLEFAGALLCVLALAIVGCAALVIL